MAEHRLARHEAPGPGASAAGEEGAQNESDENDPRSPRSDCPRDVPSGMIMRNGGPKMTETTDAGAPRGFFQILSDLYFAPREAFAGILRVPRLAAATLAWLALGLLFTGVWMSKVDSREFFKTQMEEGGQWQKMTAEQRTAVLDTQTRFFPIFGWVFAIVGPIVFLLVTSAVLMFVYRFFYASEVTFSRSLAIVAWSFLAIGLVVTPLMLLVMGLKGDWNVNPQEALRANPTLFLEKSDTAKWLWALLGSLDLFSLWHVFLLAAGFGVASKRSTSSAVWGVAVCWGVLVLGKVALALLQ
jgi:Yip1-like protein